MSNVDRTPSMVRLSALLLLVMTLAGCTAESFTDVQAPRSPLMSGFESYAPRAEVLPGLPRSTAPQVVEDSSLPSGDRRPRFSIYTVRIAEFTHLGQQGVLQLSFFNDRLQQTTFYPTDLGAYMVQLKLQGMSIIDGQQVNIGNTVVWSAVDYQGQRYVAWADQRLQEQSSRWLSRFS